MDDDALRAYNGLSFDTPDNERTVSEIIENFQNYAIGCVNETYERFRFNQRIQKEDEYFETWLSELRRSLKSCNFCTTCSDSLLRDRIVIGVHEKDTQKEMLKTKANKLQVKKKLILVLMKRPIDLQLTQSLKYKAYPRHKIGAKVYIWTKRC